MLATLTRLSLVGAALVLLAQPLAVSAEPNSADKAEEHPKPHHHHHHKRDKARDKAQAKAHVPPKADAARSAVAPSGDNGHCTGSVNGAGAGPGLPCVPHHDTQ